MESRSRQTAASTQGRDDLARVAVMRRQIHASAKRIWENVLDWEHLPWLHDSAFSRIECVESGDWGWRARACSTRAPEAEMLIEVRLERAESRYCSRTLDGPGAGTEIWTSLHPIDPQRTAIEVAFWVPGVPAARVQSIGDGYLALYERLWDEDEAMMQHREQALAERRQRPKHAREHRNPMELGPEAELRSKLPLVVGAFGGRFRIVEIEGELVAHSTTCPHKLGPLDEADLVDGPPHQLECPWHGYRFDPRSGTSCDGHGLRLERAPQVVVDGESRNVRLCWDD